MTVELDTPSIRVLETCQVVAEASGLVNSVTVPSLSVRVNVAVTPPLRVSSSAPGSAIQPVLAVFEVKWVSSPSEPMTATAVSEIRRTWE